ncbi:hypothetical protein DM01DRAFT_1381149 [Hesseltinella vesiculosa]|uniref:LAG1-DNAbind-domain-containing protein n=1 Tax=Hesseltinella vesiculosa TaxID=101127 RepID=A0A1X2GR50_9FUNG|nr:hypothetical protein DM01DRAFT_1381149 [Hesseltinella vesiculosa]
MSFSMESNNHDTLTNNERDNTANGSSNKSALDLDAILKSILQQPAPDVFGHQDHSLPGSNPSSRRHSVAVGELDMHTMDPTWFDQVTSYPFDDLSFHNPVSASTSLSMPLNNIPSFVQPPATLPFQPSQPVHHPFAPHRRAMSVQQAESFLSKMPLNDLPSAAFGSTDMLLDMNLFPTATTASPSSSSPGNIIPPNWLMSADTPPAMTTSPIPTNTHRQKDTSPESPRKRQKRNAPPIDTMTFIKHEEPLSSPATTTPTSAIPATPTLAPPEPMSPQDIQAFVLQYLANQAGERSITLLTSRVAQKSYGTEKRFLCPPPTTILSGDWPANWNPKLTVQISGELTQQTGTLEWTNPPPSILSTSLVSKSAMVGKCVSKQLHINDADEKRKRVQVMVNIQLDNGQTLGTFGSKFIKVISKPSKKRQSLKNVDLCIHHGTTVSLFNRIRSQTVSTKYLGVSSTSNGNQSAAAAAAASVANCCFVARTNVWDPFVIWIVDPLHHPQSPLPTPSTGNPASASESKVNQFPPPPAMALHHTGKEPLAVHYNQPVVLQCLTTGLVSPVMVIRKVDKGSMALSGIKVIDTLGAAAEALGDPVSQLHKVAFEIQPGFMGAGGMGQPSPSSPATSSALSTMASVVGSAPAVKNMFLACLNDVVGRHKCQTPPKRLPEPAQKASASAAAPPAANRRRSSVAISDHGDTSHGACFEQDVSDAAVWTIVGTDAVQFTYATAPTQPGAPPRMALPNTTPFPIVSSISQNDNTLCLWGEAFNANLTVYLGEQPLPTEFKSAEALVCALPTALMTAATPKLPILLVRQDGLIYQTNHAFAWKS